MMTGEVWLQEQEAKRSHLKHTQEAVIQQEVGGAINRGTSSSKAALTEGSTTFPKWHHQLGMKSSNTQANGRCFSFKPQHSLSQERVCFLSVIDCPASRSPSGPLTYNTAPHNPRSQ